MGTRGLSLAFSFLDIFLLRCLFLCQLRILWTIFRFLWKTEVGSQSSHQYNRPAGCCSGVLDGAKLQYKRVTEPWFSLKCVFNFWKDLNTIFSFTSGSSQDCNHISDFSDKVRFAEIWAMIKNRNARTHQTKSISIEYLRIKKLGAVWPYWDDRWEQSLWRIMESKGRWEKAGNSGVRLRGDAATWSSVCSVARAEKFHCHLKYSLFPDS